MVAPLDLYSFAWSFHIFLLRTLLEAIQAADALESPAPFNSSAMPARYDVCGGLARFLFSNENIQNLQRLIRERASQFDPKTLTKSIHEQVKKVQTLFSLPSLLLI
jgi:hypothetical protein